MDEENLYKKYRGPIWTGLTGLVIALGLLFFWDQGRAKNARTTAHDFVEAKALYQELASSMNLSSEALLTLEAILKRHPELGPHLDGPLALALFASGASKTALPHVTSLEKRVDSLELAPEVRAFAEISLAIEEGRDQEAIQKAHALEERLSGDSCTFSRLRAYNLIRLAVLEKNPALLEKAKGLEGAKELAPLFRAGSCSLDDVLKS